MRVVGETGQRTHQHAWFDRRYHLLNDHPQIERSLELTHNLKQDLGGSGPTSDAELLYQKISL